MAEGVSCKVVGVEPKIGGTEVILLPNEAVVAIGQIIQKPPRFITLSETQSESLPQKGYADPNKTITIETPPGCTLEQFDELLVILIEPITILVSEKCTYCSLRQTCPVYKPNGYKSLKTLSIQ